MNCSSSPQNKRFLTKLRFLTWGGQGVVRGCSWADNSILSPVLHSTIHLEIPRKNRIQKNTAAQEANDSLFNFFTFLLAPGEFLTVRDACTFSFLLRTYYISCSSCIYHSINHSKVRIPCVSLDRSILGSCCTHIEIHCSVCVWR